MHEHGISKIRSAFPELKLWVFNELTSEQSLIVAGKSFPSKSNLSKKSLQRFYFQINETMEPNCAEDKSLLKHILTSY